MTTGINAGNGLSCANCSHRARPGDRYCEQCGSVLGALPAVRHPTRGNGQPNRSQRLAGATPTLDETTRYLCAAAHHDEKFCDEAVAEFLVEPVRAIPPTPGVDSAAVLREAVAAQARRRIRDGLLLTLLVVLTLANPTAMIFWAVVVAVGAAVQARGANRNRRNFAVSVLVTWAALGLLLPLTMFALVDAAGVARLVRFATPQLLPGNVSLTLLISSLILLVLVIDEFTVAKLMNNSFRRDRFDKDPDRAPAEWERRARGLGHDSFRAELDRVARSDESLQAAGQADVVVYRGYNPFIGAGKQVDHHVIALPLEPSEDGSDTNPGPISVNDLHRHVAESVAGLRSASSLSPGQRLGQLRLREQVLMPADRLLFNRANQMHPPVLPDLSHPPLAHLPLGTARALAEDPLEWARYYLCFRVESWDRDLATSCYLHIGTDQRMLYLEWTYCVLLPVKERYRSIDRPAESPWMVFGRGLAELVTLPASVARRLRSVFRRHKELAQHTDEMVPARYGAAQSLRELAADTEAQTYFQDADVERYINIIDRTLFRAVGRFLEQRGYSVVEFTKMAEQVVNNNYTVQGNVTNSLIGSGNKNVRVDTARSGATKTKGAR